MPLHKGNSRRHVEQSRNDAHTLKELSGGRCTFVKVTELSFEGLRRALRFPDTRIRHAQPPAQASWIEGIRIRAGTGVVGDVRLGFSPNLSCVIGRSRRGKASSRESGGIHEAQIVGKAAVWP